MSPSFNSTHNSTYIILSHTVTACRQTRVIKVLLWVFFVLLMMLALPRYSLAAIDVYEFDTPQQEAQYRALVEELRCPKCQNQNLAGSDAPIAQDLKQKTYEMVKAGQTDAQIREYMYERYGDFISYKPPVRPSTWILWFFPPILLLIVLAAWIWRVKSRTSLAATTSKGVTTDATDVDILKPPHLDKDIPSALSADEQQQLDALLTKHEASKQPLQTSVSDNDSLDLDSEDSPNSLSDDATRR